MAAVVAPPARAETTFESKTLDLLNQRRAQEGLQSVQASATLETVAGPGPYTGCGYPIGGRAADMGERNYFSHAILDCGGQSFQSVLASAGVPHSAAAENIAWISGTTDPLVAAERLVNDLMASPAHRANILNRRFTHVGIGSWRTPAGQSWTGASTPLGKVWITAQVFIESPAQTTHALAAPNAVEARGGDAAITVSWVPGLGAPVVGFGVFLHDSAGYSGRSAWVCASCTTATIGDLASDHDYYAVVYGHGGSSWGPGGTSPSARTSAGGPPGPVVGVRAAPADGGVMVSWAPPATGARAVDGYGVFVLDGSGYTGRSVWACAGCTEVRVEGLTNGKSYRAAVYAHHAGGWGPVTESASVVAGSPGRPEQVVTASVGGSLVVSWTSAAGGAAVNGYGVFVHDAGGYTGKSAWACAGCTSVTISGLTAGATYTANVYGHNGQGWGQAGSSSPTRL